MDLHFLDFDYSEDDEGTATWDAVASVPVERLEALLAEIREVLAWAHAECGTGPAPLEEGGLWQYDLQWEPDGAPLQALHFDARTRGFDPVPRGQPGERITLTLSLGGGPAFAEAFASHFGQD